MIVAHDLGTSGNKASLHSDDGRLVATATVAYPTTFAAGGVAEQDPQHWWDAVCLATRQLLDRTGTRPEHVVAVGFSAQMMGAVLLDTAYRPVRPAMIWADHRSTEQADRLNEQVGAEHAYRVLGHRLHPTYSLTKILWVHEHEPEIFESVRHVCLAKDHIVQRMTGALLTDCSDASSTNAYDQRVGKWSDEVLAAADLDPMLFPPNVPASTVAGGLRAEAAEATGLRAGTPVVLGGGDGPLAALGVGVIDPADGAYAYLGSSSWVSVAAAEPLHDPMMRTMTFDHVVPGRYVPTATMQAGGASLDWVAEVLRPDDPARFPRLLAEAADADTAGLYFLPHLLGERSPHWNPAAAGAFLGLERHHGPAELVRAVLEGVAFNLPPVCRRSARLAIRFGASTRSAAARRATCGCRSSPTCGARTSADARSSRRRTASAPPSPPPSASAWSTTSAWLASSRGCPPSSRRSRTGPPTTTAGTPSTWTRTAGWSHGSPAASATQPMVAHPGWMLYSHTQPKVAQ